jgi:predicted dehydrogenase
MSDPSHFFAAGGGPLRDMGVYALHALTGLLGPVERVSAFSSRVLDRFVPDDGPASGKTIPVEVDLNWQLILDHGGGRLASLTVNFCSVGAARAPQLELLGTQGALAVNLLDVAAPLELFSVATSAWEVIALPISGRAGGPDHIMGVEHLLDSVASGDAPILSIDHALHVLDVIECAERSARDGRAVEVSGTVGSARFAALA